jgi:hypothetical protein
MMSLRASRAGGRERSDVVRRGVMYIMLRPGVLVLKMHMNSLRSHCFAFSCPTGGCDHEVVLFSQSLLFWVFAR